MDATAPLLRMQGIDKAFGGVPALTSASLEVRAGEVMALIGQNGAGKSTLIKILTGYHRCDAGTMGATVESNPRFGPKAFETLDRYARGETIDQWVVVPDRFFDRENAQQFLADAY